MSNLVLYSIPAFVVLMLLEVLWAQKWSERANARSGAPHHDVQGYAAKDTAASLSMGLGNVIISTGSKFLAIPFLAWLYQYRVFDLANVPSTWLLLFFAEDYCYYWFHRMHHQVRFLWAAHINHHSSTRYNLSTALRQSWLTPLTGPIFWAPLPLLGFAPSMVLTAQAFSLLYQFWLHTESIRSLGPLEWVLNTPSHHRVHHGTNLEYLDKNHAGILIIWDRMFGTFAKEQAPVVFGITTNIKTYNPLRIAFHEVAAIGRAVMAATTWRARLGYVIAPPGWSPDGSTQTAAQQQAAAALNPSLAGK